jgi:hypothetical protein
MLAFDQMSNHVPSPPLLHTDSQIAKRGHQQCLSHLHSQADWGLRMIQCCDVSSELAVFNGAEMVQLNDAT